jgi:uncharacterized protein (TIGR03067 family)
MQRLFTAIWVIAIVSCPACAGARQESAKTGLDELQGEWVLVARQVDGKKSTDDEVLELQIRIIVKGDTLLFKSLGDTDGQASTLKVDASKTPKTVDVIDKNDAKDKKSPLAIYKVEGDLLTVCNSLDERPTQFSADKGTGRALLVFKRTKK